MTDPHPPSALDPPPGPSAPGWNVPAGSYRTLDERRFSLDRLLPGRLASALTDLAARRGGATLLAGLFGLLALPTVILGVPGYDMSIARNAYDPTPLPPLSPAVISASIGAVVGAVLVAAPIGALVVRRFVIIGTVVTIFVAWIVAILVLPILPSLLGYAYGAVKVCIDSCAPQMQGITGGVGAFTASGAAGRPGPLLALIFSPLYAFPPLVALTIGASFWAAIVRRASDQRGSNR